MNIFRIWTESWKAWRRNEKRIADRNTRGRVYARVDDGGNGIRALGVPKAKISARVKRAGSDEYEDLGVIAEGKVSYNGDGLH